MTSSEHHNLTYYLQSWFRKNYLQTANDFLVTQSDRTWLTNLPQPGGSKLPDFAAYSYNLNYLILGEAKTFSELITRKTYGDIAFKDSADRQIKIYLDYLDTLLLKDIKSLFILAVPLPSNYGVLSYTKSKKEFEKITVISESIK